MKNAIPTIEDILYTRYLESGGMNTLAHSPEKSIKEAAELLRKAADTIEKHPETMFSLILGCIVLVEGAESKVRLFGTNMGDGVSLQLNMMNNAQHITNTLDGALILEDLPTNGVQQ